MHIGILYLPNHPHVQKWAKALVQVGARVTCFSFEEGDIEGAKVVRIPLPFSQKGHYRYYHYWLTGRRLYNFLQREGIDVLHPMHLTPFGTWAWLSGFKPMIPFALGSDVLTYFPMTSFSERHYWLPTVGKAPSYWMRLKLRILHFFYRWTVLQVLNHADCVVCDGEKMTFHLRQLLGKDGQSIVYQPIGFDPEDFQGDEELWEKLCDEFGIPKGARCILFHRGLLSVYCADIGLDAFREVLPSLPSPYVGVVLKGPYLIPEDIHSSLKELLARYPNRFYYIPRQLNGREMAQLWLHTDIFLSIPMDDGFPMSLAEGVYAGAIPILRNVPSYWELPLKDMGIPVLDTVNADIIAKVILEIIPYLSEQKRKLEEWQRWILERYDIYQNARHFLQLCEWVVKARKKEMSKRGLD